MTKRDLQTCKDKIFKCLTEDFDYGKRKDGKPSERRHLNQAIFNKKEGWQRYNGTDLNMVMDKVVLGLYFALDDPQEKS